MQGVRLQTMTDQEFRGRDRLSYSLCILTHKKYYDDPMSTHHV